MRFWQTQKRDKGNIIKANEQGHSSVNAKNPTTREMNCFHNKVESCLILLSPLSPYHFKPPKQTNI